MSREMKINEGLLKALSLSRFFSVESKKNQPQPVSPPPEPEPPVLPHKSIKSDSDIYGNVIEPLSEEKIYNDDEEKIDFKNYR